MSKQKAIRTIFNVIESEVGDNNTPLEILYVSSKIIENVKKDYENLKSFSLNDTYTSEVISVDEAMNDNSFDYVFSQKCTLFPNYEDDNIFNLKRDNVLSLERINL